MFEDSVRIDIQLIPAVCRIWKEKDPTLKGIPDPDPTLQIFSNPIPDPGEKHTFLPSQRKNFVKII